eukprot:gnl/TRDRNA2_/TRDRNA2_187111_c0_seq1.p1 gnl/TRDRNA2_/TRDRNA2_187111_c0~~gnl/TRDRNA2_/TRDRNA2_187111_c0_seq1.p1  ORF type:complete len:478 (+),score=127.24 gnl/TRDRNA2_/TRDRNA2_187111_c0_seq1:34-1434(+)
MASYDDPGAFDDPMAGFEEFDEAAHEDAAQQAADVFDELAEMFGDAAEAASAPPAKRGRPGKASAGGGGGNLDAEKEYTGVVAKFDMAAGRGFVDCEEIKAQTGGDVYIHQNVLAGTGANVGSKIAFRIHLNKAGLPQVQKPIQVLEINPPATYRGIVKSFVVSNGYGFIQCDDTFEMYGRDVYLPHAKATGFRVGQEVYFDVTTNNDGHPVVENLYPIELEEVARDQGKGKAKGKGKDMGKPPAYGAGAYGGSAYGGGAYDSWQGGKGKGPPPMAKGAYDGWGKGGGGGYKGGGYDDGYGGGKGYDKGHDAYGGGYGRGGPPAKGGWDDPYAGGGKAKGKGDAGKKGGGGGGGKPPAGAGLMGTGMVKSFSDKNGYGFIDCPDTFAIFGRDVFVTVDDLGGLPIGAEVTFKVYSNKKGCPQATEVKGTGNHVPGYDDGGHGKGKGDGKDKGKSADKGKGKRPAPY